MARPTPAPCTVCGYPLVPFDRDTGELAHCDRCSESGDAALTAPSRGFFAIEIADGFLSLFRAAFSVLGRSEYRGKLALAMVVNFFLVVLLFLGLVWGMHALLGRVEWSGIWSWVDEAGSFLSWPLALIASWFLAPAVINLGMTVFFDPISNTAERIVGGEGMKPVEIGFRRALLAAINGTGQILLLQIAILLPVMVLSLIPIIGWLFVIGGAAFSAYLNALVWFELPVLRRGYGFRYRRQVVRKNWPRALGFGLAFNVGLLVPFFNILIIGPAATVAVSTQYFRCVKITPSVQPD